MEGIDIPEHAIIHYPEKTLDPQGYPPDPPEVDASASVKVALTFLGEQGTGTVGVDIVFLIDNSGSMVGNPDADPPIEGNDGQNVRFQAIRELADAFEERPDRVAIVTFSGQPDGTETEVWQTWSSWADTKANLDDISSMKFGRFTPMAQGMELANALFDDNDPSYLDERRLYKLVILLSDGSPAVGMPHNGDFYCCDNEATAQQYDDLWHEHCPNARKKEIIYSTIFLANPEYLDDPNAQLSYQRAKDTLERIASDTQRFGSVDSIDPLFFEIFDVDLIKDKYQEFFDKIAARNVPREVVLVEKIRDELLVDDSSHISFAADLMNPYVNPETPLEDAITTFKETGKFTIKLAELVGVASLNFAVKLNVDAVDVDQDSIIVDVNDRANCRIEYLSWFPEENRALTVTLPGNIPGETEQPWPQRQIKFMLGLRASKALVTEEATNRVSIDICNAHTKKCEWLWVKEYPSFYIQAIEVKDDFNFGPFAVIAKKLIGPLVQGDLTPNLKQFVEAITIRINPYLCRFDIFTGGGKGFVWIPALQRGVFKLSQNIPDHARRYLRFKVEGVAFLLPEAEYENFQLKKPVDAIEKVSCYRFKAQSEAPEQRNLAPNPDYEQLIMHKTRPDLYLETCFKDNIEIFFENLLGLPTAEQLSEKKLWAMLDSPDIELVYSKGFPTLPSHIPGIGRLVIPGSPISPLEIIVKGGLSGVGVTIHNVGKCEGRASVTISTFMLPVDESSKWLDPLHQRKRKPVSVGVNGKETIQIPLDKLCFVDKNLRAEKPVDKDTLQRIRGGVIINFVDVSTAEGVGEADAKDEQMTANNMAIEIVRFGILDK